MRPPTARSIRAGVCKLDWKAQPARTWLAVALLVAALHAAGWVGIGRLREAAAPAQAFKLIDVALLPPPAPPQPVPRPRPADAMPVRPAPVPRISAPTRPLPLPVAPAEPPALLVEAPTAAEPLPAPPADPAPPAAVEAPRFNAAYLNNPPPAYPAAARRRGQEGRVLVRAEVMADGHCSRVELKQGSGHVLLDQAALEAVRKWRFVPARQGDQAVAAWVDVPIAFRLNN